MLNASPEAARDTGADVIVIGVTPGAAAVQLAPGAEDVDAALGGKLAATLTTLGATGDLEEVTMVASGGQLKAPLIAAVGLGDQAGPPPLDGEALRSAAGAAVRALTDKNLRHIALALPGRDSAEVEAVALGAMLGGYAFTRYTGSLPGTELTLLPHGGLEPSAAAQATSRARALAAAVSLVRDLVNTGPSDLFPAAFADEAQRLAAQAGLAVEVLDEKALGGTGYGGITGVGQGSVHPPRLVRLAYTPAGAAKTLVLAGKGITFDSGGLSLKPPKAMEYMKSDMAGAAAVLAALIAITELGPKVNVVGYLPLAENMPGGTAQRPSDVITIYGGKTVEVLNTDAEGRLVLADVLARSAEDSPDLLIDVATLTGAQLVALGPRITGVMANGDRVRDAIVDAARRAGEAAWPMPLPEDLRKGLESLVADIANVTQDRYAGMLVAGLFLQEFVPEGVPWAHLDIAGPAYHTGDPYGYTPKGGTGAAVRTLVQVACDVADGRL
jgi:leucyl aminopeptidase